MPDPRPYFSRLMSGKVIGRPALRMIAALKHRIQNYEAWFLVLATAVGLASGVMAALLSHVAHAIQVFLFGFSADLRLSALTSVTWWHLLALPAGGAILGAVRYLLRKRTRLPIDVIEANALYGGRIPLRDSLYVSLQTLISNGFGASVGLEAAYAQMGGGVASRIGQWLDLKRAALRTLVGAGAGSAIGAAFGAPLAGSFYAFEVVLGGYTPATLAPVAAASLAAVLAAHWMGAEPFVIASTAKREIMISGYLLYAVLGMIAAGLGILLIRMVALGESLVRRIPIPEWWRPVLGGVCLIPLALVTPAALSSGHGALNFYLAQQSGVLLLLAILSIKFVASITSLAFGFRGGLFFASLFLGSLLGASFAEIVNMIWPAALLDTTNAALVGMGALAAAVVGGPMCMSLMVLEVTQDFYLTAAVVTAALFANAIIRQRFGYSFSTWRLHLRGEAIRSARDIGWARAMTAEKLMRRDQIVLNDHLSVADLRAQVPLGSTNRVLLTDDAGDYRGLVPTAEAYVDSVSLDTPLSQLAKQTEVYVRPDMDIAAIQRVFEHFSVDDLAVVDEDHKLLGMLTERYVRRRYTAALEEAQRDFFGEGGGDGR